jgi:anti-anti-sigma factor
MVTDEQVPAIRDEVRARLPRRQDAALILDFAAVELINSIGITCLLQVEEDCRKQRAPMLFASVSPPIAQFLRQLKLDRKFKMAGSLDEALAALTPRA